MMQTKARQFTLSILVIAIIFACKKNQSNNDAGNPAPSADSTGVDPTAANNGTIKGFLGPDVFVAPPNLAPLSTNDLSGKIDSNTFGSKSSSNSSSSDSSFSNCISTAYGKAHASQSAVWINGTFDLMACKSQFESTGTKIVAISTTVMMVVKCTGVKLDSFDGQPYVSVNFGTVCASATTKSMLYNSKIVISYSLNSPIAGSPTSYTQTSYSSQATTDGTACIWTADQTGLTTEAPCTSLYSTIFSNIQPASASSSVAFQNSFELLKSGPVTYHETDKFYSTGHYQFIENDWSGSIDMVGPTSAPTWKATKGSQSTSGYWGSSTVANVPSNSSSNSSSGSSAGYPAPSSTPTASGANLVGASMLFSHRDLKKLMPLVK